jgi:hypothetical protein
MHLHRFSFYYYFCTLSTVLFVSVFVCVPVIDASHSLSYLFFISKPTALFSLYVSLLSRGCNIAWFMQPCLLYVAACVFALSCMSIMACDACTLAVATVGAAGVHARGA